MPDFEEIGIHLIYSKKLSPPETKKQKYTEQITEEHLSHQGTLYVHSLGCLTPLPFDR